MRRLFQILVLSSLLTHFSFAQEIALTFDDAPTPDGPLYSGQKRTEIIVGHLKKYEVTAAFFVITSRIDSETSKRLQTYVEAGHVLANHTHTHTAINRLGTVAYIEDIKNADRILQNQPGFRRWFRYPFLDEGRSMPVRDSIRQALSDLKLENGYVTVDNYDWYINEMLKQAINQEKTVDYAKLKEVYIDHIWTSIQFYDKIARQVLGRSPKHVLLLHENDLAAQFLPDLIEHLRKHGWKIISPDEAYTDPISHHIPNVLFNGQGRVGAIAREKGIPARDLVQPSEDEAYLDSLMMKENVFRN